jgi:N6-L-threonylcarbamoyladenine synthase
MQSTKAIRRILAIESSCDETALAYYHPEAGILWQELFSQIDLHATYGGVVPELAARDHLQRALPMLDNLLKKNAITKDAIDAIAYTRGPGLLGALLVGSVLAKTLAFAWAKPVLGVHHLEAHLLAPFLDQPALRFPFLALLVSGGHTQLIAVKALGDYQLLGQTLDDAAGEAFDKSAKILGLGYPGGAALSKLAESGSPTAFTLPRPLRDKGLDFSFSGLKTAVLYSFRDSAKDAQSRADLAASFEAAMVETLTVKCARALQVSGLSQLVVAGGVAANRPLRAALQALPAEVFFPRLDLCTDNAAMVAVAGFARLSAGECDENFAVAPLARWPLTTLRAPAG